VGSGNGLQSEPKDNPNRPVETVSWNDVQAFMHKLNEQEGGEHYRLPTEAQWEYACRAGTRTSRYHPDIDAIAWYGANSNGQSQPVGQKLPNAWGLYDMLGNVREWCYDKPRDYSVVAEVDPMGLLGTGTYRVIRGVSWDRPVRYVRAANRRWGNPRYRNGNIGFRCSSSGPCESALRYTPL
jgi:formylglycine-generating enzyme required for sulfatase activity